MKPPPCVVSGGLWAGGSLARRPNKRFIVFWPGQLGELRCNNNTIVMMSQNRQVGRAVTCSSLEREVHGSNLGPIKSDSVLPTARHRCDISSKDAVLPRRNDAEIGPANSLHASAHTASIMKDLM